MKRPLKIAIDGPVAAGKGDIAERLAQRLNLTYIYTGAMYRALAYALIQKNIAISDVPKVRKILSRIAIDFSPDKKAKPPYKVYVNDQDVTGKLWTPQVDQASSKVSTIPDVRRFMVRQQQELARDKSVVMEGRDIGLRVLPDADLKIYLTADVKERTRRRQRQMHIRGIERSYAQVLKDTKSRDAQDQNRQADPLKPLPDAWVLDTTDKTQSQVVDLIITELKRRQLV